MSTTFLLVMGGVLIGAAIYIFAVGATHEWMVRCRLRSLKITREVWRSDRERPYGRSYDFDDAINTIVAVFWPVTLVLMIAMRPIWIFVAFAFRAGEGAVTGNAAEPTIPKAIAKEKRQ